MHQQPLSLTQDQLRERLPNLDCIITLETTLKTQPGSIHWHIQKNHNKGTLEATWLTNGAAYLSCHANRFQPWIVEVLSHLS